VTFRPKPRKANCNEAKAYAPISLSSFMLKTTEKLVDGHIRDDVLWLRPLHQHRTNWGSPMKLHCII
jgi:hypothetical protein